MKKFAIIILAVLVVFSFTNCDKDKDKDDNFNGQALKKGTPSSAKLQQYGVSDSTLNKLFSAARAVNTDDADYQGYYELNQSYMKMLVFIWFNKNDTKYNSVYSALDPEYDFDGEYSQYFGEAMFGIYPAGTVQTAMGINESAFDGEEMYGCNMQYFLKDYQGIPKGTLSVGFFYAGGYYGM